MQRKLTDKQQKLFKKSIVMHFIIIKEIGFSGMLVHNLLLRQVVQEVDKYQMWFRAGDELLHFSIREWFLITRLKCCELKILERVQKNRQYFANTLCLFRWQR